MLMQVQVMIETVRASLYIVNVKAKYAKGRYQMCPELPGTPHLWQSRKQATLATTELQQREPHRTGRVVRSMNRLKELHSGLECA